MKFLLTCLFSLVLFTLAKAQEFKPYTYSIYSFNYHPTFNITEDKENERLILSDTLMIESVKWIYEIRFSKAVDTEGKTIDQLLEQEREDMRGIPKSFDCWDIIRKVNFRDEPAVENTFYCKDAIGGKRTSWIFLENDKIASITVRAVPQKEGTYNKEFEDLMSEDYLFKRITDLNFDN